MSTRVPQRDQDVQRSPSQPDELWSDAGKRAGDSGWTGDATGPWTTADPWGSADPWSAGQPYTPPWDAAPEPGRQAAEATPGWEPGHGADDDDDYQWIRYLSGGRSGLGGSGGVREGVREAGERGGSAPGVPRPRQGDSSTPMSASPPSKPAPRRLPDAPEVAVAGRAPNAPEQRVSAGSSSTPEKAVAVELTRSDRGRGRRSHRRARPQASTDKSVADDAARTSPAAAAQVASAGAAHAVIAEPAQKPGSHRRTGREPRLAEQAKRAEREQAARRERERAAAEAERARAAQAERAEAERTARARAVEQATRAEREKAERREREQAEVRQARQALAEQKQREKQAKLQAQADKKLAKRTKRHPAKPEPEQRPDPRSQPKAALAVAVSPPVPARQARPSRRRKRKSRTGTKVAWLGIATLVAVAVAASAVMLRQGSGGGIRHVLMTPAKIGAYGQAPRLATEMKAEQLRHSIVVSGSGEASHVVDAVYEDTIGQAAKNGPQIVLFIAGNLSGTSASSFIASYIGKLPGAVTTRPGALGGQAACVPSENGRMAECAWADNDTFGVLASPTLGKTALANELRVMRRQVERRAK